MTEASADLAQVWKLRYERLSRLYGLLSDPSPDYQERADAALRFALEQLQGQFAAVGHLDRGLHVFDYYTGDRGQPEAAQRAQWNHLASKHLSKTTGISVCSNTTGQADLRCDERNCGVGSFVSSTLQYGDRKWLLLVGSPQPRPTTYTDSDQLFIEDLTDFFIRVMTQRESRERIATKAYYDGLTRAVNRHGLLEYLTAAIAAAQRGNHRGVLLYMDLNGFKQVNDTFGHKAGDVVLRDFADRIRTVLRAEDFFARLGGDEFAVVMPHVRT
ncbi:MAG: GGDEF domain-containing protein, partial [Candidatus Eremiobacteraeota bacterium]|nr:GGDEF domain-containing protein [Candidatus Eremiobacteraeota bacterium]